MDMQNYWLLFAIGAGLASNLANFTTRYLIRDEKDSASFSIGLEVFRVLAFGLVALFDFHINWSFKTIGLLTLLGLIEPLSIYTFMKMHEHAHLSISSIVSRSRMIWVAAIAFVFLGETLRFRDYLGIAVLFLGLSVAVAPKKFFVDKGVKMATIASIIAAVVVILIKAVSKDVSLPVMMVWMSLPSVFIIPLFMKNRKQRIKKFVNERFRFKLLFNVFNFLAMYGYVFAIKYGSVSISTAIYHGMIVFAVIAGIIFLNEREDVGRKIVGSVIATAGILFLV